MLLLLLFYLSFKNINSYYLPYQIPNHNSYGKFNYFNCNFRNWLAVIPQLKTNGRDTVLKIGSRGSDVKYRISSNKRPGAH